MIQKNLEKMKLDQLHYFVETARRQHIGQAASFLHISPSAISHSIAALEKEIGKPLFVKYGRYIKLTEHGKTLLDRAESLLVEIKRIREDLSSNQFKIRGHYRIAATHVICSEYLTPTWIDIQNEHPKITATLNSLRSEEVLSRVNAGEVDLGICFSPYAGPNHEQETIHKGKLVFCFGKKHPFLKNRKLKDIAQYPSISAVASQGIENCGNHPSFQKLKIQPQVVTLFDSYDVAIHALKSNAVWGLLPDFLAYSNRTEIESYVPRGWDAEYSVTAIWPKHNKRTKVLDDVIEKIRKRVRKTVSQ